MRPLFLSFAAAAAVALVAAGCGKSQAPQATATPAAAPTVAAETVVDEHSYAQPDKVRITDIALDLAIDFDKKEISGSATYTMRVLQYADPVPTLGPASLLLMLLALLALAALTTRRIQG